MTKVTTIHKRQGDVKKYAWCQRKVVEEPQYFDIQTICSSSMSTLGASSSSAKGAAIALSPSSQTCQMCYQQNPQCSGSSGAGISVVSFSVDTQGEADDLVQSLFDENLIADVNFLSAMVNRKFSLYGQVTNDPSQVRIEIVTSDTKTQSVMSKISSWKASSGKSTSGADNDVVITPLSGGSAEYISFVLKQTSGKADSAPASSGPLVMSQQELPSGQEQRSLSLTQDDNTSAMMAKTGDNIKSMLSEFY
jgi:hypothetical protein